METARHHMREFNRSRRLTPAEVREIGRQQALAEANRFVDAQPRHRHPTLPADSEAV